MTTLIKTTKLTKSKIFSVYNKFRVDEKLDRNRVNRAFGIIQKVYYRGEYELKNTETAKQYHTTSSHCDCPDYKKRGKKVGPCKHIIAVKMYDAICSRKVVAKIKFWSKVYSVEETLIKHNYSVAATLYNAPTDFEVDKGNGWTSPKQGASLETVKEYIEEKNLNLRSRMVKYYSSPWRALYEVELVG